MTDSSVAIDFDAFTMLHTYEHDGCDCGCDICEEVRRKPGAGAGDYVALKSRGPKFHPPIHKGCDCFIEPDTTTLPPRAFRRFDHQVEYNRYFKEYEGKSVKDLAATITRDNPFFMENEMLYDWQIDTQGVKALALKYKAQLMENRTLDTFGLGKLEGAVKAMAGRIPDSEYLRIRAATQAQLRAKLAGKKQVVRLWRGIEGRSGRKMADEVLDAKIKNPEGMYKMQDNSMASWSNMKELAQEFGDDGVVVMLETPADDIFMSSDLLKQVNLATNAPLEGEYIVFGGKRTVALKNISVDMPAGLPEYRKEAHAYLHASYEKKYAGWKPEDFRKNWESEFGKTGIYDNLGDWTYTPVGKNATGLKMKTALMEGEISGTRVPDRFIGLKTEDWLAGAKDAAKNIFDEDYVKLRAYTQAYYKSKGIKDVKLYRGIGGRTGEELRGKVSKLKGTDLVRIEDDALSSWTPNREIAEGFTKKTGVIIEKSVPVDEILVSEDVWRGIATEHEFILTGRKGGQLFYKEQFSW